MMKFLHIADLHIGKRLCVYSLLDDQEYWMNETLAFLKKEEIPFLLISGDIYDVTSPSAEAIQLFDYFLNALAEQHIETFIIPGNHDSKERMSYAKHFLHHDGIHIVTTLEETLHSFSYEDVNIYLLPYVNHHEINEFLHTSYEDYSSSMKGLMEHIELDQTKANILLAHQLVLPSKDELERSGSENITIGTVSNIPVQVFQDFSYVALGHIHKPQTIAKNARYAGSPLKYHSDEAFTQKFYTVGEVDKEGVHLSFYPITPKRDVVILKGYFEDLLKQKEHANDYVYFELLDENMIENAMEKLKQVYPYALDLHYPTKVGEGIDLNQIHDIKSISTIDLFFEFYEKQNGKPLTDHQKEIVTKLLKECEEK